METFHLILNLVEKNLIAFGVIVTAFAFASLISEAVIKPWREARRELTELTNQLTEISFARNQIDLQPNKSSELVTTALRLLKLRRRNVAYRATMLMKRFPRPRLTEVDCNLLAGAFHSIGDVKLAEHYWSLCIKKSDVPIVHAQNLRESADFQFCLANIELGRQQYAASIDLIEGASDVAHRTRADTLLMWARSESEFKDGLPEARRQISRAFKAARQIQRRSDKMHLLSRIKYERSSMNL